MAHSTPSYSLRTMFVLITLVAVVLAVGKLLGFCFALGVLFAMIGFYLIAANKHDGMGALLFGLGMALMTFGLLPEVY